MADFYHTILVRLNIFIGCTRKALVLLDSGRAAAALRVWERLLKIGAAASRDGQGDAALKFSLLEWLTRAEAAVRTSSDRSWSLTLLDIFDCFLTAFVGFYCYF